MANIRYISIHDSNYPKETIRVHAMLKPAGEVYIDVPLPREFFYCIVKIAQLAVDQHEQQMRAQILADTAIAEEQKK